MSRRAEIQVFNVSFLDVLSCALGGVLILLLMNMDSATTAARSYETQAKSMQDQINQAQSSLNAAQNALSQAQADADSQRQARQALEDAQTALIGLKGDMGGVVFIFDTSGSMNTSRFSEYKQMLKDWILHLEFNSFNVIEFNSQSRVWQPNRLVPDSKGDRERASRFVDALPATGNTNTLDALEEAFQLPGLDTIILMSDGAPNQPFTDIHRFLKSANSNRRVKINTVGMGNYFHAEYGDFLQEIAADHDGMFIGR